MPTISEFSGIVIRIYHEDHSGEENPPHFHAYCGKQEAVFDIARLRRMDGMLSRPAYARVLEWAMAHREELQENWLLAEQHEPLKPIEPLDHPESSE